MSGDSNYTFQFWSIEIHFILSFWKHSNRTSSNTTLNFKILESSFLLKKHFHVIFTMFGRFAAFPKYHSIARLLKGKPWTNYSVCEILFTYFTVSSRKEDTRLSEILPRSALPRGMLHYRQMTKDDWKKKKKLEVSIFLYSTSYSRR